MKQIESTNRTLAARITIAIVLFCAPAARADHLVIDSADEDRSPRSSIIVPFAFSTEALSTGVGLAYVKSGGQQRQQNFFLTGYYTSNDSYAIFGGLSRRQILSDRLFFSPRLGVSSNTNQRFYGDLFIESGQAPSGSNSSSEDDFVFGEGTDSYLSLDFRYLLPIGNGKENPVHHYGTTDGILTSGSTMGSSWNPIAGGRTFIEVKPFYQRRTMELTDDNINQIPPVLGLMVGDTAKSITNGIGFSLEYDNRDFLVNPARGSHTALEVERDFGWFDSNTTWTSVSFDFAKYLDLGTSKNFRQKVLALNAWTAYVPTWDVEPLGGGEFRIHNRPPSNRGATLGGVKRLRGYPRGRFNDKAAVYYSAELRLIPEWNPLATWPLIRNWPWRWWQWVGFAEIGRVAPTWNLSTLHEDMKWSAGIGARAMIGGGIMRFDFAKSNETTQFWVFFGQTF